MKSTRDTWTHAIRISFYYYPLTSSSHRDKISGCSSKKKKPHAHNNHSTRFPSDLKHNRTKFHHKQLDRGLLRGVLRTRLETVATNNRMTVCKTLSLGVCWKLSFRQIFVYRGPLAGGQTWITNYTHVLETKLNDLFEKKKSRLERSGISLLLSNIRSI